MQCRGQGGRTKGRTVRLEHAREDGLLLAHRLVERRGERGALGDLRVRALLEARHEVVGFLEEVLLVAPRLLDVLLPRVEPVLDR